MRIYKILLFGIMAAVLVARADDEPTLKLGLWQTTAALNGAAQSFKTCYGEHTQQALLNASNEFRKKNCTKLDVHISGSTETRDSVCRFGGIQITTHDVITFTSNTAYRDEQHVHYDPPLSGKSDNTTVVIAKWMAAACADGMKPGDMMTADGRIVPGPK